MALTTFFSRRQRPLNTAAVCLLMIGYTSQGLLNITGLAKNQAILLALPQSVTLICSTLALVVVLKWFNIRTIIFSGMLLALVIISQLGQIAGRTVAPFPTAVHHKALATFVASDFFWDRALSLVSPISSTYLATVYTGRARPLWLSVSQGLYGVGAGIIPLTASRAIYNLGGVGNDFSQVVNLLLLHCGRFRRRGVVIVVAT